MKVAEVEANAAPMNMTCKSSLHWHGCYTGTFDLITPESITHPAKMAPQLCFRIIEHLESLGFLHPGDTILDPMNGIATTGIAAGAKGYAYVGVELEPKFVELSLKNKKYAEAKLYKDFDWKIIQGDSRKLSELLSGNGFRVVMSPPYENQSYAGLSDSFAEWRAMNGRSNDKPGIQGFKEGYGTTEGQIGNLTDRPLKAVTSPPYEGGGHHKGMLDSWGGQNTPVTNDSVEKHGYGSTPGQIEDAESYLSAMAQVYAEIAKVADVLAIVLKNPTRAGKLRRLDLDTIAILEQTGWTIHCQHRALLFEEIEKVDMFAGPKKQVKGRLSFFKRLSWQKGSPVASWEDVIIAVRNGGGNMKAVTSPPYAEAQAGGGISKAMRGEGGYNVTTKMPGSVYQPSEHGQTPGQIGNLKDRT